MSQANGTHGPWTKVPYKGGSGKGSIVLTRDSRKDTVPVYEQYQEREQYQQRYDDRRVQLPLEGSTAVLMEYVCILLKNALGSQDEGLDLMKAEQVR